MNCRVVVEAAVPVYDVGTADEAVRIAISKTGEMLNPDLNYVEIDMRERTCPHCGDTLDPAFLAADESLVALELEMTVFNVERDEHAARIARKEIGQRMDNIPLTVLEIEELPDDEDEDDSSDDSGDEESTETDAGNEAEDSPTEGEPDDASGADESDSDARESRSTRSTGETSDPMSAAPDEDRARGGRGEDDVLPEFEELIDE